MTGIQIILLTGILFIGIYYFVRWQKKVLDIVVVVGMIICAAVFVLFPDATSAIATKLGVGRGADLVFYLSILTFWFLILKLYSRIRRLEQMFTRAIQSDAIQTAKTFPTNEPTNA